jgi:hypothetical protein
MLPQGDVESLHIVRAAPRGNKGGAWHGARVVLSLAGPHRAREDSDGRMRMADANAGGTGRGAGGTNVILVLLVVVVLALVAWMVMRGGGDDSGVNVDAPSVSTPDVDVKQSGDGK